MTSPGKTTLTGAAAPGAAGGGSLPATRLRLQGREALYAMYKLHRGIPQAFRVRAGTDALPRTEDEFETQLRLYGFASIDEFATCIARFENAFEAAAARIALDLLARYAAKLAQEQQRYRDPEVVKALYADLGGFRTQHQRVKTQSQLYAAELATAQHTRNAEQARMPGNGGLPADAPSAAQVAAKHGAILANAAAKIEIESLATKYPIFAEGDLPVELRIDKEALGRTTEAQLAGFLQAHIARRTSAVAEARAQIQDSPALVYRMTKLMPSLYAELGIPAGSIFDQIVQDKQHSDVIAKIVSGIALAIVGVALTTISLGTATPAAVAVGSALGSTAISTYLAVDEYNQYAEGHALADVGYAPDPSLAWVVVAIVGAGFDMRAAVNVVRKLAPAAKALAASGSLDDFAKAVEALRQAQQLDERAAAAIKRAAEAHARSPMRRNRW